ncbi:MAG TPA: hypothetical protein VKT80_19225, partial [Chloroflexota bacterium]|nr:hypothetical protein [Chloroflexota bacterium]
MITSPTVVLGFYFDRKTSARVLRDVRRNGWRRSVLLSRSEDPQVPVGGHDVLTRAALVDIALSSLGALLLIELIVVNLTGLFPPAAIPVAIVLWAVGLALVTIGAYRYFGSRLSPDAIRQYRRWILPGESLIIVQVPLERAGPVMDLLRPADGSEPSTFVIRRSHRFLEAPSDFPDQERFADDRLKLEANRLATRQEITNHPGRGVPLRERVSTAERIIETITSDLAEVGHLDQGTSVATEWLLDNIYIVQRHAADVRRNLSRGFYNVLPVLKGGDQAGEPRIYEIALELVAHSNGEFHERDIIDFVLAYQDVTPLTVGELWVLPLMLRAALIESLSRLATEVDLRQYDHERADLWANRILSAARRGPDQVLFAAAELAREHPNPSPYVVDRIISQLQGESSALDTIRAWLERKLGDSLADVIQQEQRRQAADQVAIANAIGSLRELSRIDWRDIFERLSPVDRVLEDDPMQLFRQLDFGTRDRYRAAIENFTRASGVAETAVARQAVELAQSGEAGSYRSHVGYYLVDEGHLELEARLGCRWGLGERLRRAALRHPTSTYLAGIGLCTGVVLAAALLLGGFLELGEVRRLSLLALALCTLIPASDLGIFFTNYLVTRILPPRVLPKLSFADGIPAEWGTLVVVPT